MSEGRMATLAEALRDLNLSASPLDSLVWNWCWRSASFKAEVPRHLVPALDSDMLVLDDPDRSLVFASIKKEATEHLQERTREPVWFACRCGSDAFVFSTGYKERE